MIDDSKFVVLVTGTINPDLNVSSLVLKDSNERLQQYKESLLWLLFNSSVKKIVFCDNSLCPQTEFLDVVNLARKMQKEFEFLSFQGDTKKTVEQGKGYGEGEIIEYALNKSELLAGVPYFIKITGRLKVDNLSSIIKHINTYHFYINMFNKERVDTRIYSISKELYNKFFLDAYKRVDDEEKYYIEHVFTDIIKSQNIKSRNFPRVPRYVGISGSTGKKYQYNRLKSVIKDVLCLINYFGLKA